MKFVRRDNVATSGDSGSGYTHAKPQQLHWRKEWIENQPKYMELSCGHKVDLHDRALLIINSFKDTTIYCDDCDEFRKAIRSYQYVKPAIEQDVLPPF